MTFPAPTKEQPAPIFEDSPEAATPITVTAWKSRTGHIFLEERAARYNGATHRRCQCGGTVAMNDRMCYPCREKHDVERWQKSWEAGGKLVWDGETPIYSDAWDRYFFDFESLIDSFTDYEDSYDTSKEEGRFYLCKSVYAREVDVDYWCDDLGEDNDLPSELYKALEAFNATIKAYGKPLSYTPDYTKAVHVAIETEEGETDT
jgi:hypothetical protein